MSVKRTAAKRDSNERPIIDALIDAGCSVIQLSERGVPDLLIGYINPAGQRVNILLEVKQPRARLTTDQQKFFASWVGQCEVVRSVNDALNLIRGVAKNER